LIEELAEKDVFAWTLNRIAVFYFRLDLSSPGLSVYSSCKRGGDGPKPLHAHRSCKTRAALSFSLSDVGHLLE
jgi:hypothetical protein